MSKNKSRINSILSISKNIDYITIPKKYSKDYSRMNKDKKIEKLGGMKFIFIMSFIHGFYFDKKDKITSGYGAFRLRVFDEAELWTMLSIYNYKEKEFIENKLISKKITDKKRVTNFREILKEIEQYAAAGFPDFKNNWEKYEENSIYEIMENINNKLKPK